MSLNTEPKGPTLKHQRPQDERQIKYSGIDDWYRKGVNKGKVATRYRKVRKEREDLLECGWDFPVYQGS